MDATAALDRDGFIVLPEALADDAVRDLERAVDLVYAAERHAGRLAPDGSLHLLGALGREPALADLVDAPSVLGIVAATLGWNIYAYHSHLDVHPPVRRRSPCWRWHQDGGRQNLEIETEPTRPRLSLKVAWFLSDASSPGRGNLMVLPGSHRRNRLPRPKPEDRPVAPEDARPVLATRGSAVIFDRRLWHARSDNVSAVTRKVVFIAYAYRWVRPRETVAAETVGNGLTPLRRQLLGAASGDNGHWLPTADDAAVRDWLDERGLLDRRRPAHR